MIGGDVRAARSGHAGRGDASEFARSLVHVAHVSAAPTNVERLQIDRQMPALLHDPIRVFRGNRNRQEAPGNRRVVRSRGKARSGIERA